MIESDIQADLAQLTGLPVYPLMLPSTALEGVTSPAYQRSPVQYRTGSHSIDRSAISNQPYPD
ncbi:MULTISPECIES: hypothetical protein [Xenorhabdus]|uniref:hypothetical protein n=1 Tax=Xenorhabdus TaxID=626 RepID=UPI000ABAEDF4|nr:hypothetical protein [Xenorhabdus griffiniae]